MLCDYAKAGGKTSVVISADKPYDVQLYPNADAILATYGCKGSSVDPTEALTGGATGSSKAYGPNILAAVEVALGTFAPQGKLPLDIPVYDVVSNTYTSELAYARGYGLTYASDDATADPSLENDLKSVQILTVGITLGVTAVLCASVFAIIRRRRKNHK